MRYRPHRSNDVSPPLAAHGSRRVLTVSVLLGLLPLGLAVLASYPVLAVGLVAGYLARPAIGRVTALAERVRQSSASDAPERLHPATPENR